MPKGLKGFQKGNRFGCKVCDEVTKERIRIANTGKYVGSKSVKWKGEGASLNSKHRWINRNYGNPIKCEDCGVKGVKSNGQWTIE